MKVIRCVGDGKGSRERGIASAAGKPACSIEQVSGKASWRRWNLSKDSKGMSRLYLFVE